MKILQREVVVVAAAVEDLEEAAEELAVAAVDSEEAEVL